MTSKDKIHESDYNFMKLQKMENKLSQEYIYEFNCFLSSTKSIFDHLLEDYNIKYNLGIPLHVDIRKAFHEKAKSNSNAKKFIQWFEKEYTKIRSDSQYGFLLKERNITIHRRTPKLDKFVIKGKGFSISAKANESTDVRINAFQFPPIGIITTTNKETGEKTEKTMNVEATSECYLKGNPNQPIDIICQALLERIKKFVSDADNQFK